MGQARRRLILLDYDGTLVPFAATPEEASPDAELRELLERLAATPGTTVALVSGRPRAQLETWFGDLPVGLSAEHGAWGRWPGEPWRVAAAPAPGLPAVVALMEQVTARTTGSRTEAKERSAAWHYRMVDPRLASRRRDELVTALTPLLADTLEILEGSRVIEVRSRGVDKGSAVRGLIGEVGVPEPDVLVAGDDVTDEDMFAAVAGAAVSIRVGGGLSRARFRVVGPGQLRAALGRLR